MDNDVSQGYAGSQGWEQPTLHGGGGYRGNREKGIPGPGNGSNGGCLFSY